MIRAVIYDQVLDHLCYQGSICRMVQVYHLWEDGHLACWRGVQILYSGAKLQWYCHAWWYNRDVRQGQNVGRMKLLTVQV